MATNADGDQRAMHPLKENTMSGGTLPRTGIGALSVAVPGVGVVTAPAQVAWAIIGATLVLVGIMLVRLTWRRNKPVDA